MEEVKRIDGKDMTLEEAYLKHYRLICKIASRYKRQGEKRHCDLDDLISVGKVGFIQAYERFDETRGAKFSTFATPYISGHILMEFRRKSLGVTVTSGVKERAFEILKTDVILEELTVQYVMDTLGVSYKYAYEVFYYLIFERTASIYSNVRSTKETSQEAPKTLSDSLGIKEDFTTAFVYENRKLLTEKEQVIYDLMAQGYTQSDIRDITGLKRTTINMRVLKIKEKLSHVLEDYRRNG